MTSKSSFFDLMKENLMRRIWAAAISVVGFFLYFPILTLLTADLYLKTDNYGTEQTIQIKRLYSFFEGLHGGFSGFIGVILVILAVIMAVNAFSYLHDQQKVDFYHSLPITRRNLFAAAVINSILIVAIPYFLMALISGIMIGVKTGIGSAVSYAAGSALKGICYYLLFFAVSSAAMLLTGKAAVGILGTLVFFFYGPIVVGVITSMMEMFFHTLYYRSEISESICARTSPVFWMFLTEEADHTVHALIALAAGLVILALTWMLYKHRRSESAGHPMAFRPTEAPLRCLMTVPFAVGAGLIIGSIPGGSDGWYIFGIIFSTVAVHSVIEIIMQLDFRKLFAHKVQMLFCLAAALAFFGAFRCDIFGYDKYLPEDDRIESAGISSYALAPLYGNEDRVELHEDFGNYYASYRYGRDDRELIDNMALTNFADLKAIAADGIARAKSNNAYADDDSSRIIRDVIIGWHLKNGKTVYRSYPVDMKTVSGEMRAIYMDPAFKAAVYPILTKTPEEVDDFVGVNYRDLFGPHHVTFNGDSGAALRMDIAELWNVYCEELSRLTIEERQAHAPVLGLQFKSSRFQEMVDLVRASGGYIGEFNDIGYYPVYPCFTKTLALLAANGVPADNEALAASIHELVISDIRPLVFSDEYTERIEAMSITDPEQIRTILNAAEGLYYFSDDCVTSYEGLEVTGSFSSASQEDEDDFVVLGYASKSPYATAEYDNENNFRVMEFRFNLHEIPEFVKEHFKITDQMLEREIARVSW